MATRVLHGIDFFEQLWKSFMQVTFLPSFSKIGPGVQEKKSFEGRKLTTDGRRTTDDGHQAITKAHHEHFVLR
jgi:hypothetical protein